MTRRRAALDLVVVLAIAVAMLLPALWNGYPFVFSDTGEYLARADVLTVPAYRTVGYSVWIALMGARTTLWATAAAQSLLLAALLAILARALVPRLPRAALVAGGAAIAIFTAASTRASQIMPDVFAPVLVLSLYLLVAAWDRLGTIARSIAVFGVLSSVVMHVTHVAIAVALVVVYAVGAAVGGGTTGRWRAVARGALCVAIGTGALLTYNFSQTRRLFIAQNGHVFILSHLVDSGLASRLLREECPHGAHYDLCPYVGMLDINGRTPTPDEFVWNPSSPLYRIGGWEGSRRESARILRGTLHRYPFTHALDLVSYTLDQLSAISTLDGLESYARISWVDGRIRQLRPQDYPSMHSARQQTGTLGFDDLARVHDLLARLAAAASVWLLYRHHARRDPAALGAIDGFHRTVWFALIGNAVLCGNLSGVYARYQARLVWLLPLAILLSVAAWRWPEVDEPQEPQEPPSGGERVPAATARSTVMDAVV